MLVAITWTGSHRLVISSVLALLVVAWLFYMCTRPKSPKPLTWAKAMLGAVGSFAAMILVYGVVPDEWMQFADSQWNWSQSRTFEEIGPITINYRALKDTVAVLIYVFFFAIQITVGILWQKRKPASEVARAATAEEPETKAPRPAGMSRFGRPLSRRA